MPLALPPSCAPTSAGTCSPLSLSRFFKTARDTHTAQKAMASASGSKNHAAKPPQPVDAGPPPASNLTLKRGTNGSGFIRCDSCKKDIPAATLDTHDCKLDAKTKAVSQKLPVDNPDAEAPLKEKNLAPIDKRAKRKAGELQKARKPKKAVKEKDPYQPRRPPTAFFLFMEEFRNAFRENNPNSVLPASISKDGGKRWKSMSDEEKACFVTKASYLREEYWIAMKAYRVSQRISNGAVDTEEGCGENDDPAEDDE